MEASLAVTLRWARGSGVFFGVAGAACAAGWAFSGQPFGRLLLSAGLAAGMLFLVFFRDPERKSDAAPDAILAPADGTVLQVETSAFSNGGPALRIAVAMHLGNVHVQRLPCDGVLRRSDWRPGRHWPIPSAKAAEGNERRVYAFGRGEERFEVVQIAGMVARRTQSWLAPGTAYARGERLGIILFGSEVDLYLPTACRPVIRPGMRVRAGETVVAIWPA